MKLVTKNTGYAIRALIMLAGRKGAFVSAREIAKKQNLPYQYLRRILQKLIAEKIVTSKEGGKGGVKLNIDPEKIRIGNLLRIFQGRIQLSECLFGKEICQEYPKCVLRKRINSIEEILTRELEKINIGNLIGDIEKRSMKKESC